jgi:hypothetical protein
MEAPAISFLIRLIVLAGPWTPDVVMTESTEGGHG